MKNNRIILFILITIKREANYYDSIKLRFNTITLINFIIIKSSLYYTFNFLQFVIFFSIDD